MNNCEYKTVKADNDKSVILFSLSKFYNKNIKMDSSKYAVAIKSMQVLILND